MSSPLADTIESVPYAAFKGVKEACEAALKKRDPKGAKERYENSSIGRTKRNALRSATERELLKELMRRQSVVARRKSQTERQREFRERQKRRAEMQDAAPPCSDKPW